MAYLGVGKVWGSVNEAFVFLIHLWGASSYVIIVSICYFCCMNIAIKGHESILSRRVFYYFDIF